MVKHGTSKGAAVNVSSRRVRRARFSTKKFAIACANPLSALQDRNFSPQTETLVADASAFSKNARATFISTQLTVIVNVSPKNVMKTSTSILTIVNASA